MFSATSCSWLNLVERWFAELTNKRIRRGDFRSVAELIAAIQDYLAHTNEQPRPFVWTASVESIMAKVNHCKAIYETAHYHGKAYVVLIWDNASWHKSEAVQSWIASHNATRKQQGLPKLFLLALPTYSPWLNPTEAVVNQNKRRTLFGRNQPDPIQLRTAVETNLLHFHPRKLNMNHAKQH
jgi:transposase